MKECCKELDELYKERDLYLRMADTVDMKISLFKINRMMEEKEASIEQSKKILDKFDNR